MKPELNLEGFKATKNKKDFTVDQLKTICDECGIEYAIKAKEISLISKINKYVAAQPETKTTAVAAAVVEPVGAELNFEASKEESGTETITTDAGAEEVEVESLGEVEEVETVEETEETEGAEDTEADETTDESEALTANPEEVTTSYFGSQMSKITQGLDDLAALAAESNEGMRERDIYSVRFNAVKKKIEGMSRMLKRIS
tara:strand:- start:442 stop:1047 length:606 start_codon:yes stop_codon:yes gene_type:complete